jgi:hypothetical protein
MFCSIKKTPNVSPNYLAIFLAQNIFKILALVSGRRHPEAGVCGRGRQHHGRRRPRRHLHLQRQEPWQIQGNPNYYHEPSIKE